MSDRRPSHVAIGVGLALAILCGVLGWPALLDPTGQALGGGGGDLNGLAWTLWRVVDALPGVPRHHPDIQWPAGAHLAPVAVPQALLTAPVTALLGPVASVNLLQVAHVALAGGLAAGWAAGRGLGRPAAVAAGLGFGLAPVLLASVHNGNPDVTPVFWLPLVALLAERAGEDRVSAGGLGLALALAPGWSPYVGVMAGLVALVVTPWPRTRRAWGHLGAAAMVGVVGLGLWAAFYMGAVEGALVLKRAATPVEPGAASLRGFLDPRSVGGGADGWSRHRWYLGAVGVGLGAVGVRELGWRSARPLALVAAGVLLALGPTLQWDGAPLDIAGQRLALPGAAWIQVPGLDGLRLVWRYAALASLGVALLAAHGVAALPVRARWVGALLLGLDLLLLGGGRADLRAGPVRDDGGCVLLEGREPGPVLSLPHDHEERGLLGQTCHGMPVAGSLNRVPGRPVQGAIQAGPAALRGMGFRWLLLDPGAPGDGGAEAARLATALGGAPVATHDGVSLYDLQGTP
jgi:hypothetical protein